MTAPRSAPCPLHGPSPVPLGPGAMVLVVGASGAGKDTLMSAARTLLADRPDIHVARRLVTRTDTTGEDHVPISAEAFAAGLAAGRFPLAWAAHGLSYALGPEVAVRIAAGETVMANGSRATLPEARRIFLRPLVVHVTAPAEVRAARLAGRGREAPAEVSARLARTPEVEVSADLEIENIGSPQEGGRLLAAFVRAAAGAR